MPEDPKRRRRSDPLDDDDLLAPDDASEPEDDEPEPPGTPIDPEPVDDDEPPEVDWGVPIGVPYTDAIPDDDDLLEGDAVEPEDDGPEDDEEDLLATDDSFFEEPEEPGLVDERDISLGREEEVVEEVKDEDTDDLDDAAWSELEVDRGSLPPGRILVGYRELVHFPDLELYDLPARCDTGAATSSLVGRMVEAGVLALGPVRLPLTDEVDGVPVVKLRLALAGSERDVVFRVAPGESDVSVVLGRDALEGWFVVDVAQRFIHRR